MLIDTLWFFCFFIQALFFGGVDKLPAILGPHTIPVFGIVVDPCAAVLVLIVTFLLCTGIKEVFFFLKNHSIFFIYSSFLFLCCISY